jgi:hypothetical protein
MATTPNIGLILPVNGAYIDTWDQPVNANSTAIDTALGGSTTINVTGVGAGSIALTLTQYTPRIIEFTGALTAAILYYLPAGVGGTWTIVNSSSNGGGSIGFGVSGGGTLPIAQNQNTLLYCDGTNLNYADTAYATAAAAAALTSAESYANGVAATAQTNAENFATAADIVVTTNTEAFATAQANAAYAASQTYTNTQTAATLASAESYTQSYVVPVAPHLPGPTGPNAMKNASGVIEQWGISSAGATSVSFYSGAGLAFTAAPNVQLTVINTSGSPGWGASGTTTTGFNIVNNGLSHYWRAIGT